MHTQFYEPRDMHIQKMKTETRLRIRANVRYSDVYPDEMTAIQITIQNTELGLPLATVQSGQRTIQRSHLRDRGQMVYLSDRRQTVSLK